MVNTADTTLSVALADNPYHGNETNDGRIDYVEFGAQDIAATKAFYTGLFGWNFTDYGPDYTSFEDGRIAGGLRARGADEARWAAGGALRG